MKKLRRVAAVGLVVAFEVAGIVVLHRLGRIDWMTVPWNELRSWLDTAPREDVVAALLRTLALGIAYWLALSTTAYVCARAIRAPRLIAAAARTTLPTVRRAIDRTIAVTATGVALALPPLPLGTHEPPPPPEPVVYEISDRGVPIPGMPADPAAAAGASTSMVPTPVNVMPPGIVGVGYVPQPRADDAAAGVEGPAAKSTRPAVGRTGHIVVPGDNLWKIAAASLNHHHGEEAEEAAIAPYWRRVIAANQARLLSGDPDLIFPGELIVLPDPSATS